MSITGRRLHFTSCHLTAVTVAACLWLQVTVALLQHPSIIVRYLIPIGSTLMVPCSADLYFSRGGLRTSPNADTAHMLACPLAASTIGGILAMVCGAFSTFLPSHPVTTRVPLIFWTRPGPLLLSPIRLKVAAGSSYQLALLSSSSAVANIWSVVAALARHLVASRPTHTAVSIYLALFLGVVVCYVFARKFSSVQEWQKSSMCHCRSLPLPPTACAAAPRPLRPAAACTCWATSQTLSCIFRCPRHTWQIFLPLLHASPCQY
jgi:hypothetical protein